MFRRNVRKSGDQLFANPKNSILYKMFLWFAGRHWLILGLAALFLFFLEAYDFDRYHGDYVHVIEFIVYFALLFLVGLLIDLLIAEIRVQTQTKEILDFKHKLSLEFSRFHDWAGLTESVARFPGRIAPVSQACLLVADPISGQFISAAQWNRKDTDLSDFCSIESCQDCLANDLAGERTFYPCKADPWFGDVKPQKKYCLSFRYGGRVLGVLPFLLEPGKDLTGEQVELFENIGDEIAIALHAGQDRRSFVEMKTSETALAERREVSDYLHDHLGQSLGYLHIKMDQLIIEKDRLSAEKVFEDLTQMREAVNDSYEIVRGILETIHSETSPSLNNLLMEHARKISQRANLAIDFKTRGKPSVLPAEIQRAVFYAFEESLSNAEKHARATRVDILAEWGKDNFVLTIADDGVGFNPQAVDTDQHFGMEILNERMAKVNGRITLTTSENSGTIVNIHVPSTSDSHAGKGL